jgi:hypothetical protein
MLAFLNHFAQLVSSALGDNDVVVHAFTLLAALRYSARPPYLGLFSSGTYVASQQQTSEQ